MRDIFDNQSIINHYKGDLYQGDFLPFHVFPIMKSKKNIFLPFSSKPLQPYEKQ